MSSKKNKRKARNTMIKNKPDLGIPISIDLLGTESDPCFGKLFDPRADECKRCGDAEICAIAMAQRNHILRNKVEKEHAFKDLEEVKIPKPINKKVIRKSIRNRVREMVKMSGKTPIDMDMVIDDIFASYSKDGFKKTSIKKIINKMAENSSHLTLTKNKLKWN